MAFYVLRSGGLNGSSPSLFFGVRIGAKKNGVTKDAFANNTRPLEESWKKVDEIRNRAKSNE